jgi:putative addiction module killer protein
MRVCMTEVYRDWVNGLRDRTARARIQVRVDRLANGNPGEQRNLGKGVRELKIDFGPGYRVYYTERGGDKSSQQSDIRKAFLLAEHL